LTDQHESGESPRESGRFSLKSTPISRHDPVGQFMKIE
jgi:hypothetical protein